MDVSIDHLKKALCDGGKILSYKGLNESFGIFLPESRTRKRSL